MRPNPLPALAFTPSAGRSILEAQRDQLAAAIAIGDDPFDLALARRLHSRACTYLLNADGALDAIKGMFGRNGWQPGVDDVCDRLARRGADAAISPFTKRVQQEAR